MRTPRKVTDASGREGLRVPHCLMRPHPISVRGPTQNRQNHSPHRSRPQLNSRAQRAPLPKHGARSARELHGFCVPWSKPWPQGRPGHRDRMRTPRKATDASGREGRESRVPQCLPPRPHPISVQRTRAKQNRQNHSPHQSRPQLNSRAQRAPALSKSSREPLQSPERKVHLGVLRILINGFRCQATAYKLKRQERQERPSKSIAGGIKLSLTCIARRRDETEHLLSQPRPTAFPNRGSPPRNTADSATT